MSEENMNNLVEQRGRLVDRFIENSNYPDYLEGLTAEIAKVDALILALVGEEGRD